MADDITDITDGDLIQEPEPQDPPAEPVAPADPPKQTAQERINEITYKFREAEREVEYWKNLALADAEPEPEPAPTPPPVDGRPVRAHFESQEKYEDALLDWRDEKRTATETEKQTKERMKKNLATFNENAKEFRKENPDFDEVIETPVFNDSMREILLTDKNGPALTYSIAKNKATSDYLLSLTPAQQLYEIGKLSNQLTANQRIKPVSTAPEPLDPVSGEGIPEKDPSKMSIDEWMEWNKQHEISRIKSNIEGRRP